MVTPPADKSISQRAALFAALAEGTSTITGYSYAGDPKTTLSVLRKLGVPAEESDGQLIIHGKGRSDWPDPQDMLDCGNSGTTFRLLSGLLAGAGVSATLTGDASLCRRTMKRIIEPLRQMGTTIDAVADAYAPLNLKREGELKAIRYRMPVASAQVKSCILLAGLFSPETTRVVEPVLTRNHTETMLQLPVERKDNERIIHSSLQHPIPEQNLLIPGDFSSAAFWIAAGCILDEVDLTIEGVGLNPTRTGLLDVVRRMDANVKVKDERVERGEPAGWIRVQSSKLRPVTMHADEIPDCIDELPVITALMVCADGVSSFRGAEELRHKESDRLDALAGLLRAAGVRFEEHEDGLTIYGDPAFRSFAAVYDSMGDHRIAMTAAILSLRGREASVIRDADCVGVSYPGFWNDLAHLAGTPVPETL